MFLKRDYYTLSPMAVLDSHFRVRGTKGLRVVDASVMPGTFIVLPVLMMSEHAADEMLADAEAATVQ